MITHIIIGGEKEKMIKIMPLLIAAILLSLATASSASVSYSYDTDTTGMMTVDESYRLNTHGNSIVGSQYSLDLIAINSEDASCNYSFSADPEVNSETNVSYSRNDSEMIGGLYLEENSGASLIIDPLAGVVGCYESAIDFSTEVDSLQFSSAGWIQEGSQKYNITARGEGNFEAGLEATSMGGEKWLKYSLLSEERISSYVGARSGDFNFTANYNVIRP